MENLDVALIESSGYNTNLTGEPVYSNVGQNVCCFISNLDKLVICDYSTLDETSIKIYSLENNIHKTAFQIKYLNFWKVVYIATQTNLLIFDIKNEKLLVAHSFMKKITYTSWHPEEMFLVVIDETSEIHGFNFNMELDSEEFYFLANHSTHLDASVPGSVYVGWGSYNTQFKGANNTEEEVIIEINQPYSPPIISWRGNGEQFVINFWKDENRYLKIFDSSLAPQFQSEEFTNLLPPVSFKGQGNFIACAATVNGKNKIFVFEKNCLRKSEFGVPENKGEIKCLQYHPDKNMLAVYSEDLECEDLGFHGYLNIYFYSNAKWYLKQQFVYPSNKKLFSFDWGICHDNMCVLNVLTSESVQQIWFRFIIQNYPDTNVVGVIDGCAVHFTDFSVAMVPPPMYTFSMNFEKPVNKLLYYSGLNICEFITSDNQTHSYSRENGKFVGPITSSFPQLSLDKPIPSINIICHLQKTIGNINYDFVLDRKQNLLINNTVVSHNVWSLYLYDGYILFTHASSQLYCRRLNIEDSLELPWDLNTIYHRSIEQGAKIVCITPDSEVILQLPRGNLEAVSCRFIAIDNLEKSLAQGNYKEAIYQIKRQRLNWNLLIDLNAQRFFDHITEFIQAVSTSSMLNTIVSEFNNNDCIRLMYNDCIQEDRTFYEFDKNRIFAKILDEIIRVNPVENFMGIITLQVKHFSLKSALRSVLNVFQLNDSELCKQALYYILFYVSSKQVINEAYTLYNIDFMRFVYNCCGEDPKVYEPVLARLLMLEPLDLRYKMNILAKNFKGATKFLVRSDKWSYRYVSDFIHMHATYSVAYESLNTGHPKYQLVSQCYAYYLGTRNRHKEAGLILERAELYEDAFHEYKKALDYNKVISLLETVRLQDNYKNEVLESLAEDLKHEKKVDEAVFLYEYHLDNPKQAIRVLLSQEMFQKALSLAQKYDLSEMIENTVTPEIIKFRTSLFNKAVELGDKFEKLAKRLQIVRYKKLQRLRHEQHFVEEVNDDVHSEYGSFLSTSSRASSMGSRGSRGSTASARNRRKQEKRRIDLREGGRYEDIALIRELYNLAQAIFECGKDFKEVALTLVDDESFSECTKIQHKIFTVHTNVKIHIPVIWSDTFMNAPPSPAPEIMAEIEHREDLDAMFRTPPPGFGLPDDFRTLIFTKK